MLNQRNIFTEKKKKFAFSAFFHEKSSSSRDEFLHYNRKKVKQSEKNSSRLHFLVVDAFAY
jgi:capsule polysaccharide export protein KpsE/RkpR